MTARTYPRHRTPLAERLWRHIKRDPATGCWNWTGHVHSETGYGRVSVDGAMRQAHVAVYELLVETVPVGLELDHTCRNRRCVNPSHVEPVTHAENVRRGEGGANHRDQVVCIRGHPFSEDNTRIRPNGSRECRTCQRAHSREWKRRQRASQKGTSA